MGTTICSANDHYAGVIRKYIQQQEQRIEKQKEWYESRIHFHGVALDGADEDCRLTTDANNKLIQRIKELESKLSISKNIIDIMEGRWVHVENYASGSQEELDNMKEALK